MDVECRLEFEYQDKEIARRILDSVRVDNSGFVDARIEGTTIISLIKAKSLKSLLHTLEDYLSCLSLAEKVVFE